MSNVENLWERLVRAAALGRESTGNVPSSLSNDIDTVLRTADEIEEEDPNISRILCEHAYKLAQKLDPNSEGRGVLQFKTGLMSVIKQKSPKNSDRGRNDRSRDMARLQEFYKRYRENNNADKLHKEEMELRESDKFSGNLQEFERKTVKKKSVFATLKVLGNALVQLESEGLIPRELKQVIEFDAAMKDLIVKLKID